MNPTGSYYGTSSSTFSYKSSNFHHEFNLRIICIQQELILRDSSYRYGTKYNNPGDSGAASLRACKHRMAMRQLQVRIHCLENLPRDCKCDARPSSRTIKHDSKLDGIRISTP